MDHEHNANKRHEKSAGGSRPRRKEHLMGPRGANGGKKHEYTLRLLRHWASFAGEIKGPMAGAEIRKNVKTKNLQIPLPKSTKEGHKGGVVRLSMEPPQ